MNNPNALKWEKTYRYGCSTYAGTRYTAEAYLHYYVIDVIGTKSTGQEFILNISCSYPAQPLEYSGKSKTHLQMIAENYHQAVRKYIESSACGGAGGGQAGGGRTDVRSLFNLFRLKYQKAGMTGHPNTVRDLEKGVFIL